MNLKLIIVLFVITIGAATINNDVFGQTLPIGDSPYAREYIGTEFLDAYFGMMGEKIEVNPGDQNIPLLLYLQMLDHKISLD